MSEDRFRFEVDGVGGYVINAYGKFPLQPTHTAWAHRRVYWRVVWPNGKPLTKWMFTPELAALRALFELERLGNNPPVPPPPHPAWVALKKARDQVLPWI